MLLLLSHGTITGGEALSSFKFNELVGRKQKIFLSCVVIIYCFWRLNAVGICCILKVLELIFTTEEKGAIYELGKLYNKIHFLKIFGCSHGIRKFLGRGLNLSHSCSNARSFNALCWVEVRICTSIVIWATVGRLKSIFLVRLLVENSWFWLTSEEIKFIQDRSQKARESILEKSQEAKRAW